MRRRGNSPRAHFEHFTVHSTPYSQERRGQSVDLAFHESCEPGEAIFLLKRSHSGQMTARRIFAWKGRKRVVVGLCFSILLFLRVDSVQIPTHRTIQEPDAAPYNDDDVVAPLDNDASPNDEPSSINTFGVQAPRIPQDAISYRDFMDWCTQVLGIQTSLEIKDFEYDDYMKIRMSNEDDVDELCDPQEEFPPVSVRGLAASRNIQPGDVVISIPFHALLTVPTTIDHDPVLSGILGPSERAKFGWEDSYFETPLLTVCLLYHKHLGRQSPLHHYIELLESNSPRDSMPLLWNSTLLKREATSGVRRLVRGIQSDVKEMYQALVVPLQTEHAAIFDSDDYSLQKFLWAFSMVNSRHWYLPIPDLSSSEKEQPVKSQEADYVGFNRDQILPASQPTDEWVREQGEQETDDAIVPQKQDSATRENHSFMAPVADLLNFGPPCTRGSYNDDKKAFELIATCPFLPGQEVTFWYSDDCEDVMIANYGFTHPMVPRCPSVDDWRAKSELWKQRAERLETELEESYKELGRMDVELEDLRLILHKCECDNVVPQPRPSEEVEEKHNAARDEGPTKLRRFRTPDEPLETADGLRGVRDDVTEENNHGHSARHGVRKKWHHHGSMSGNSSL